MLNAKKKIYKVNENVICYKLSKNVTSVLTIWTNAFEVGFLGGPIAMLDTSLRF